jgi:hypothetical protein
MLRTLSMLLLWSGLTVSVAVHADDASRPRWSGRIGVGFDLNTQYRGGAGMAPVPSATPGKALAAPAAQYPQRAAGTATVLTLGVSMAMSSRSRLRWEGTLAETRSADAPATQAQLRLVRPQMQLAWQSKPAARLASPLRLQLEGGTRVTFKPGRHKFSVTMQHEW